MKQWKDWPDDCPECGDALEIETDALEEGECYDGDAVKCIACGFKSGMSVYEDGTCAIQDI